MMPAAPETSESMSEKKQTHQPKPSFLGRAVSFFVQFRLSAAYWYWKWKLGARCEFGRDVRIYERVKLEVEPGGKLFVGSGAALEQGSVVTVKSGAFVSLEEGVYIGEYTVLTAYDSIKVGQGTMFGPHCVVKNDGHSIYPAVRENQTEKKTKIEIGSNAWISAGCHIAPGVTIGEGVVLGAGSVAAEDIPSFSVAVGVPAKVLKFRDSSRSGADAHACGARYESRSYWEAWAKQYPDPFDSVHRAKDITQLRIIAADAAQKLQLSQEDSLLDLGCGSGKFAELLAPHVRRVDGVDGSEEILEIARNATRGVFYHRGECAKKPFPDHSFDKVICYSVFHYCGENFQEILQEIRRVIRPQGRVLIGDLPDKRFKFHFYFEILKRGFMVLVRPKMLFKKFKMAKEMKTNLVWFDLKEVVKAAEKLGWKAQVMKQPPNEQYGWKTHTHRFDIVLS